MEEYYKSHFKVYLILWISILLCHFTFFIIYLNNKISICYFVITVLFAMVINGFEGHRITNYLKQNNKIQYMRNQSFKNTKGVFNNFSAFEFLVSNSNLEDINITKLKSNYKKTILLILIIFFSYPLFFIITNVIA